MNTGRDTTYVVGIDGGATRTRYVLADRRGGILGRSEGPASLLGVGLDEIVADRIADEVESLVASRELAGRPAVFYAGLAGAPARPEVRTLVRGRLVRRGIAEAIHVVSDGEIAHFDAFGAGPGVLLVAGTGSIALARSTDAGLVRSGGWGTLLGDEGSGYWIGCKGLRAAVRGAEGRDTRTSLQTALFGALDAGSVPEVYRWSCSAEKGDVAALAPLVAEEAELGDAVAGRIVQKAAAQLVRLAVSLQQREDVLKEEDGSTRVALVGGLVGAGGVLREELIRALKERDLDVLLTPVQPERGAVRRALSLLENTR